MKHLIILLMIVSIAACSENPVEPIGAIQNPQNGTWESTPELIMDFEEMINSDGRYMVIDHGNQHLYFDDGNPSCPDENELNEYVQISFPPLTNYMIDTTEYDHINPPPITNYSIHPGRNGHLYYEKEGIINYMVYDHLVDYETCIWYYEVIYELCENGLYRYCILTKEDCYMNDYFVGTRIISEWCGPCDILNESIIQFKPWNVLCQQGLIDHN